MTGPEHRQALVIGSGIVGAACAQALAADGREVLLVDRAEVASGTTRAGMGHVVTIASTPPILALTRYSQQLWHARATGWGTDVPIRTCGTLWVARDDPAETAMADRLEGSLRAARVPCERWGPVDLRAQEPRLAPTVAAGVRVPEDLVVDAVAATRRLVAEARRAGAEVREGTTVDRLTGTGVVLTDGSAIEADEVVVAAGVDSVRLLPGLGLRPRKGHLIHLETPVGYVHAQLAEIGYAQGAASESDEAISFNVQPAPAGGLYVGASRQFGSGSPEVEERIVEGLFARAREFLPDVDRYPVRRRWTGFRPAAPDHLPFIGPWPDRAHLWVAAGHEGLGITTSLATGRVIADLIARRPPAIDAEPFAPRGRLVRPTDGAISPRG